MSQHSRTRPLGRSKCTLFDYYKEVTKFVDSNPLKQYVIIFLIILRKPVDVLYP